jgi:glycosyltransferase involved in cell wall biosynthesis
VTKSPAVAIEASKTSTAPPAEAERWLFVDGADSFGGHEVMLLRWLEELATQRTVHPVLLARGGSRLSRDAARHAVVRELPPSVDALRDAAAFVRIVSRERPSVCVIAEGCLLAQPVFLVLAKLIGLRVMLYVPMLQTSASMGFRSGRARDALVRRIYSKLPHGWITITREQGEDFRRWANVKQPILVLQNTVARAIEAAAADMAQTREVERLRVLILGRLEPHQKGLDTLLDYVRAHPDLGRRLQLNIVGTGPFKATIASALADDPVLASWVSLSPWSATLDAMRSHDVLLMTSRYEGVPLVMLEAMALGVPVVAPDFAGTRAFLQRDCMFEAGDLAAAFAAIARLEDSARRLQTADRNRVVFAAQASNDAFAASVRALTPQIRALGRRRSMA